MKPLLPLPVLIALTLTASAQTIVPLERCHLDSNQKVSCKKDESRLPQGLPPSPNLRVQSAFDQIEEDARNRNIWLHEPSWPK